VLREQAASARRSRLARLSSTSRRAWPLGTVSPLELTATELRLLACLVRQRCLVLSKHQLLTEVWSYEAHHPNLAEVDVMSPHTAHG